MRLSRHLGVFCLGAIACLAVAILQPARAEGRDVIITNDAPGVRAEGAFERTDAYLSRSPAVLRGVGGGAHRVTVALEPGERGYYRVFVWWPQIPAVSGIDVTVHHLSGSASHPFDRPKGGQWNAVGIFELPATGATIEIVGSPGAELVVDALRLQYVGVQAPPLSFETNALPIAIAGLPYEAAIEVIGNIGAPRFAVDASQLPAGLTLDPASGTLAGVPDGIGHYEFDVEAFDGNGQRAQRRFALEVTPTPAAEPSAPADAKSDGAATKDGVASGTPPNLANLIGLIAALPEGGWAQASLNSYSSAWTPPDLRPLVGQGNPDPMKIILAWSGFAWDPNRGDLLLFGGGHANYSGNDVYRWRGSTRRWERAALPSEVKQDSFSNWPPIDGWNAAPASAHTYDNNIFFPHIDRLVIFGGATYDSGSGYRRELTPTTSRPTGPYFFDPAKADPNKVGGTTGSHVKRVAPHPEVIGGNMWTNRDLYVNLPSNPALPVAHVNGCTAYADENGKDVAYVGARSGGATNLNLYKYTVNALASPGLDRFDLVGAFWSGTAETTACSVDPVRKLFVRSGNNAIPFVYWNLATPGAGNRDVRVTPVDPTGEFASLLASNGVRMPYCGLDFDPVRRRFLLWCGDGRVWALTPPAAASPSGWTIVRQPSPTLAKPNGDVGTGILGKWKYISSLDAFIGLQDPVQGNIWIYKPVGWVKPQGGSALPPSPPANVSASDGTSTTSVTIAWTASTNATSYTIYRSTAFGTTGAVIGTSASTSFNDTTAVAGTTYFYGITATGAGGTSALSAQNSGFRASAAAPSVPTGVSASDGTSTTGVAITWSASANATGYRIYRSTAAGTPGGLIGTSATTSFTDTTAAAGTTYYYGVTATGPGGTSALSAQNSGFRGILAAAPSVPTGVSASDGTSTTSVAIAWSASTNATSYTIYRSTALGTRGTSIGTSATRTFTDTTAVAGTTYFYGITATGPGGTSALSAQNGGFRAGAGAPSVPTGVSASDGTSTTSVTITWNASTNATRYTIYRATGLGTQGTSIGTSATTSFIDTTAVAGNLYFYGVAATGPGGTSAQSAQNGGFRRLP